MASVPESYLGLTPKQRIYVDGRLAGLTKKAAAAAAGQVKGTAPSHCFDTNENVQQAIIDMTKKTAEEVGFTRKEAHDMYMNAYNNAETAMEQIAAVNAMVKLHGLEAPKKLEVKHEHQHSGELELLPTHELLKLAGMQDKLTLPGEYEVIEPKPALEPPEATDDNTAVPETLRSVSEGY